MLEILGTYDGAQFKPLPSEVVPEIKTEMPAKLIVSDDLSAPCLSLAELEAMASRWQAARASMPPLDMSIPEMINAGRED